MYLTLTEISIYMTQYQKINFRNFKHKKILRNVIIVENILGKFEINVERILRFIVQFVRERNENETKPYLEC